MHEAIPKHRTLADRLFADIISAFTRKDKSLWALWLLSYLLAYTASASIRVGTYNIQDGAIGSEAQRIALIRNSRADVVGIQEANSWRSLKIIADSLGFHVFAPHVEDRFTYATAVLSRYPIVDSVWWRANGAYRSLTAVAIALPSNDTIGFFSLHLEPSDPLWRLTQLDVYKQKIAEWQSKYRCFVVGDFNSDLATTLGELHMPVIGGSGIDWITGDEVFPVVPGSTRNWGSGGSDHNLFTVDVNVPLNHLVLIPREGAQVLRVVQDSSFGFSTVNFSPQRNLTQPTIAFRISKKPTKGILMFSGMEVDTQQSISLDQASKLSYGPSRDSIGWDSFQWQAFDGTSWGGRRGTIRLVIEGIFENVTFGTIPAATNSVSAGIGWYDFAYARRGAQVYAPHENGLLDSLPDFLNGLQYMRNGGGCESPWPSNHIFQQFDLRQPTTVYIAFDPAVRTPPLWLTAAYARILRNVPITGGHQFDIYRRDFSPGRATLYGNNLPWENRNSGFTFIAFAKKIAVRVGVFALLEGPYDSTTRRMNTTLKTSGVLAAHFPTLAIPTDAIDSITIELRDAAINPTVKKFCPAWLLKDGRMRNFTDTTKNYVELDTVAGNYYIVVHHRNHIAIMSSTSVALNANAATFYDFTTSQTQAYGTNAMKQVGAKFMMFGGDANQSDTVTAADANEVFGLSGVVGYSRGDIMLKGVVTSQSVALILSNLSVTNQAP